MRMIYRLLAGLFIIAIVTSCKQDCVKVDVEIKGLGTQNVHLIYCGDYGATEEVIAAQDDKLEVEIESSLLTVVSMMDAKGMLLARFAAQNGDHIKIKGDLSKLDEMKISGNDATEQWMKFRKDNAPLYASQSSDKLDQAIEKWVKEHPKQVSSALMLIFDHSALLSSGTLVSLLTTIAPEARPNHLMASVEWLAEYYSRHTVKKLNTLNLCGTSGDFEQVKILGKPSLLYFWSNSLEQRKNIIQAIRNKLRESGDNTIMVAGILLDADTLQWKATCLKDSATWKQYWVPGGVSDFALKDLRISSAPFFVTTDSLGKITYRGNQVMQAIKALP